MFSAAGTFRTWGIALGVCAFAALAYLLRGVLVPVFFAWLLAYMLDPLVDRLEAVRIPRGVGIVILLFVALVVLALFGLFVLPAIVRDFVELGQALYRGFSTTLANLGPWLRARHIPIPDNVEFGLAELGAKAFRLAPGALGPVGSALETALGSTASVLGALGTALLVPVFSFYFLYDFDRMVAGVRDLIPSGVRPRVVAMASEVNVVLGHFVRGQLTVMAILAVLYALGYAMIGIPLAVPIGVLAGLLSFIPYVGSGIALAFGLLMVALHYQGLAQVAGVVTVYAVVQVLDGLVITPRVVGGKLGLSPVWVLFALLAFGQLFGFLGVMVALPASAVIKVFVVHGLHRYRGSALFHGRVAGSPVRPARLKLRRDRRDRAGLRNDS